MSTFPEFLFGVAVGLCFFGGYLLAMRGRAHRLGMETYKLGFIRGLQLGAKNHAEWITRHDGIKANGFACACAACGNIQETILNHDAEWWTCGVCGHRQGAPLCEAEKEVPF